MKVNTLDVKPVKQVRNNKNTFCYFLMENGKLKIENILIGFAVSIYKIFSYTFSISKVGQAVPDKSK